MTRRFAIGLVAAVLASAPAAVRAQSTDDHDLDRIPAAPTAGASAPDLGPASNPARTVYVEDATSETVRRSGLLVPPPAAPSSAWQNLLFLDARTTNALSPQLTFTLGARANLLLQDDIAFPDQENVRLDIREAYVTWSPRDGIFVTLR